MDNNYEQLMHKLDKYEKELADRQAAEGQAKNELEQGKMQFEQQKHQDEMQFNYYKVDADNDTDKLIEVMKLQGNAMNSILAGDQAGQDEAATALEAATKQLQEVNLKREELAVKREDSQTKLAIAKENKYKHEMQGNKK